MISILYSFYLQYRRDHPLDMENDEELKQNRTDFEQYSAELSSRLNGEDKEILRHLLMAAEDYFDLKASVMNEDCLLTGVKIGMQIGESSDLAR
ncbi:MAG: hypothetical protein DBX59_10860 [Bacillota bacterium]|nr:MAG: hypothetical protein DBX59_10860 [Bacillota bacterium]